MVLASAGCGLDPAWTGINVNAPEEWVDGTVAIDGRVVGKLKHLALHDSALEKWQKNKHGDSSMFHTVALNVPLDRDGVERGVHKVRIAKAGRGAIEGEFTYPDPRGSSIQFLSINGESLVNSPGPAAHGSHP